MVGKSGLKKAELFPSNIVTFECKFLGGKPPFLIYESRQQYITIITTS